MWSFLTSVVAVRIVLSRFMATISHYHAQLSDTERRMGDLLAKCIAQELPESEGKIWHAHPVWFLGGNPIVGYSKQKAGIRLMFWSGASFDEPDLSVRGGKFQDASIFFTKVEDISRRDLVRWLAKAREIQWDYKNIVRRKGKLEKIPQKA